MNEKLKNLVDGVRTSVRDLYWKAEASALGRWVPSPQIIGGAAAVAVNRAVASLLPGYDPPPGLVDVAAGLFVAYWIGPEPAVEFYADPEVLEPPNDGGAFQEPEVPGEFVGPGDDDTTGRPGAV